MQRVRGDLYMIAGAGGNVTMLVGPDNVLLVDTGNGKVTDKVLDAIRQIIPRPIRYIINTNARPEHTGGNENIAKVGNTITGGLPIADATEGAAIIAHEQVLSHMSSIQPALPFRALPTETYFTEWKKLSPSIHGDSIQIFHEKAANTNGDSIVHFRSLDAISAGDIFVTTGYPPSST